MKDLDRHALPVGYLPQLPGASPRLTLDFPSTLLSRNG